MCVCSHLSLSSVNYLILLNLSLSEAEIQLSVIALRALWELRRPAWAERSEELSGLLILLSEHSLLFFVIVFLFPPPHRKLLLKYHQVIFKKVQQLVQG